MNLTGMPLEEKNKILVICPHPVNTAPGQRLKYEQYFDYFKENGIEIKVAPFMSLQLWNVAYKKGRLFEKIGWTVYGYLKRMTLLFTLRKYRCIYIFLWVTPFGSTLFEWLTVKLGKKIIYDIDDLVYLKPASKANPLLRFFKSGAKPIFLMKNANHVITCTPYLDSFVKRFNSNTTDISSTINTDLYQPVNSYSNNKKLTLGWSGSFSTSKYLKLLEDVLLKLKTKYDFHLLVIGDSDFFIPGLEIESIKWDSTTEVEDLQRIDIGLYPLPEEEWVLGKSGLKALQYMALGIPTVATKVGANHRVIENGVSGFLVKSKEEWQKRLSELIEQPDMRREIGANARKRIEDMYSIKANRDTYLSIINANL